MSEVTAKDIVYEAGGRPILRNVSFDAGPGFTALIGPNGAGKTTLLRILSGYLRPKSGSVAIDGQNALGMSARERAQRVAVVAQSSAIDYDFSVLDIVLMGRTAWNPYFAADSREDVERAKRALVQAGASELADRSITALSGGERQRVMIARAFCQDTGVLLLDEPVSALDLRYQVSILDAVSDHIRTRGTACVCVLHDLNLAAHFADRVVLMEQGQISCAGAPREVLRQDILEKVYRTAVRVIREEEELLVFPDMRSADMD